VVHTYNHRWTQVLTYV